MKWGGVSSFLFLSRRSRMQFMCIYTRRYPPPFAQPSLLHFPPPTDEFQIFRVKSWTAMRGVQEGYVRRRPAPKPPAIAPQTTAGSRSSSPARGDAPSSDSGASMHTSILFWTDRHSGLCVFFFAHDEFKSQTLYFSAKTSVCMYAQLHHSHRLCRCHLPVLRRDLGFSEGIL